MILHDSNSFRKWLEKEPTYDIFKRREDSYPYWITAVGTLQEARERTTRYGLIVAGEYFTRREKGLFLSASLQRRRSVEPHPQSGLCRNLGIPCDTEEPPSKLPTRSSTVFEFARWRSIWSISMQIFSGEPSVYSLLSPRF